MLLGLACDSAKKLSRIGNKLSFPVQTTLRAYASRKNCAAHEEPWCSKERLASVPDCPDKLRRIELKQKLPKINSMWEDPECCRNSCPDYYPRYDELYYKSNDKAERKYQQTWISFPKMKRQHEMVCVHETEKYPPMEYRIKKPKPKNSCPIGGNHICKISAFSKCPRIRTKNCPTPPCVPRTKCVIQRGAKECEKCCAPTPSYSECLHNNPEFMKSLECKCLDQQFMCQVWAEMRRRTRFVKPLIIF